MAFIGIYSYPIVISDSLGASYLNVWINYMIRT
jgi:hypothetical protein